MKTHKLLYLSQEDVKNTGLSIKAMLSLIEQAFIEKGQGKVEMPPKPGIHPQKNSLINAMLAWIPGMNAAGVKWVSAFSENKAKGLPYVSGLIILNDGETGLPYAVMDAVWLTGYRTAAASALSAKYLARPESNSIALLACGLQARTHLETFAEVFPLEKVYAWDLDPAARKTFIEEMGAKFDLEFVEAKSNQEAVENSDLVITSGPILKTAHESAKKSWLKPGSFASAVDYDSYWQPDAVNEVDKFCVDDTPQWKYYQQQGYFQTLHDPYADLGELAAGLKPGRESDEEITFAMNLGLAIDDIAVAPQVYNAAVKRNLGTWLDL